MLTVLRAIFVAAVLAAIAVSVWGGPPGSAPTDPDTVHSEAYNSHGKIYYLTPPEAERAAIAPVYFAGFIVLGLTAGVLALILQRVKDRRKRNDKPG